jgi:hypothetical protein
MDYNKKFQTQVAPFIVRSVTKKPLANTSRANVFSRPMSPGKKRRLNITALVHKPLLRNVVIKTPRPFLLENQPTSNFR